MNEIEQRLQYFLNLRKENHTLRSLYIDRHLIDFSSNDYLGLAHSAWIKQQIQTAIETDYQFHKIGATGSRLLSGNSKLYEDLEKYLAKIHHADAALIFNSGYSANLGVIATVCRKNDLIIYDELCHASILQACKLSLAEKLNFVHNDIQSLEAILKANDTKYEHIFIISESVFSMDGDFAPLKTFVKIAQQYNANLIVDEAHATGIFGKNGAGYCSELGIENDCFARIYTFGKAMGTHGAVVVGSVALKDYLINFAKSFIYSTALNLYDLLSIKYSYEFISQFKYPHQQLIENINYFKSEVAKQTSLKLIGEGPIFALIIEGSEQCKAKAKVLQQNGLDIKAIVYPTVPKGKERLRIILHSFNTKNDINLLIDNLGQ